MDKTTLYQHGTLALLVPGLFQGTQRIADLMTHGDTGIGTLTGLDGELIMLDGVVYQINAAGQVRVVDDTEMVPFANVHFADFKPAGVLHELSYQVLQTELAARAAHPNAFYAVQIRGTFSAVKTRAVAKQNVPYPSLTETAAAQSEFERSQDQGVLSGYYAPALYAGAAVPGFHLHYLSADHQFGGHVLSATVADATAEIQIFTDLQLHLPVMDSDFRAADLTQADMNDQIKQAEQ